MLKVDGIIALYTLPEGRATPQGEDTDAMTARSQGQLAFLTPRQAAVRGRLMSVNSLVWQNEPAHQYHYRM